MKVPAILLAAGGSRRLGHPKQLVCIAGENMLARTIRVVREAGVSPVFVVTGSHHEDMSPTLQTPGVVEVHNADWESGIASSIRSGVHHVLTAAPDAVGALLLVCDQPRLSAQLVVELLATFALARGSSIVASEYAGVRGIPAIFPAAQFDGLLALVGDEGARHLLRDSHCPPVVVPFEGGEVDLDTPRDISAIETMEID